MLKLAAPVKAFVFMWTISTCRRHLWRVEEKYPTFGHQLISVIIGYIGRQVTNWENCFSKIKRALLFT